MQQTANIHQFVAAGFDPKTIAPDRSSSVASGDGRSTLSREGVRIPETGVP
jgi:hypothetical protein